MRWTWGLMFLVMALSANDIALGAIATPTTQVFGTTLMRAQLLTDAITSTDGEWIDVSGLASLTLHVSGITTATVEVDGSNEIVRPANDAHGIKLNATDIASDQIVFLTGGLRWLKVRIPDYTSGTINVYLEGRAPQ